MAKQAQAVPDACWIDIGFLPGHIGLCLTPSAFERTQESMGVKDREEWPLVPGTLGTTTTFGGSNGSHTSIVCVDGANEVGLYEIDILTNIVHEVIHCWQHLKEYIHETEPGHEIEAYFIAEISGKMLRHYQEYNTWLKQKNRKPRRRR